MDSGNSGSLQSSSGDEEYDSRSESISAFLNPSAHDASLSNPSHHHLPHPPSSSSSLFDPFANYLDSFSRSPAPTPNAGSSLLNLDMVWPRGLRSEPTCTDIPTGGLMGSSSSSAQQATSGQAGPFHGSSSTVPLHTSPKNGPRPSASSSSDQTNPVRNSKKRSRASRRAPTTVLTTDTSNFRAMVQEFTGIPAPPFSASPFTRNRFDLFGTTMRSSHLEPPPPYLLRPFAQKFHPSSASTSSSSIVDVIASATNPTTTSSGAAITTAAGSSNTSNSTSTNNHQLLSNLGFSKQTQNLPNMQNPIFTFQSLLQASGPPPAAPPPRYPLTVASTDSSQLRMGTTTMAEDFTMGGHGLPSLVNSDGMSLRNDDNNNNNNNNNNPSSWGDGMGLNDGDQSQAQLKPVNGNYSSSQQQRASGSCKMNYTTSSLEFQVEKGSENVSSRGEGMVDSWICSSD